MASRPLMCRSMGRPPMAHPPGMATRAMPVRAMSGPKHQRAGAHGLDDLVLGDRIGEHGALDRGAVLCSAVAQLDLRRPWNSSSLRSVSMSRTCGMFSRMTSSSVRMAAAMQGKRGVLCAGDFDGAEQRVAAADDKLVHIDSLRKQAEDRSGGAGCGERLGREKDNGKRFRTQRMRRCAEAFANQEKAFAMEVAKA